MRALSPSDLERELVALQEAKTPALQTRWRELLGSEPPRKMRSGFLRRAIAYRLQEQVFGGLKPEAERQLQRLATALRKDQGSADTNGVSRRPAVSRQLSPGTRLMREWNGTTEWVDVVDEGFVWRNRSFRTLSAVAVAITGTKWSGPKFFGLDRLQPVASLSNRARQSTSTAELAP